MNKDLSRREFVKVMGVGALAALGTATVGCSKVEEDKITINELKEYHVFKHPVNLDDEYNEYLFLKEQMYLDNYMYICLNVIEEDHLTNFVYITLAGNEKIDLDNGKKHVEFSTLLNEFNFIDLGNAVDVVGEEIGKKNEYTATEIAQVVALLKEKDKAKRLVKTK